MLRESPLASALLGHPKATFSTSRHAGIRRLKLLAVL